MQRTQRHLLQKLYCREIYGSFDRRKTYGHDRAVKLFKSVPERLIFCLKDIIQTIGNHVLLGMTRCGQFLVTYSFMTDRSLNYKYRLHWWAFRLGAAAWKVAEVQLFDNYELSNALSLGIAQWPNINDKLVIYGYSDWDPFEQDEEGITYYVTVTTLPSLHNCPNCKKVAESFDEEDMAADWDSFIGMSCLKHGLTIHTTLEMSQHSNMNNQMDMDLPINLKIDNKIIFNTVDFLHVLSFGLDRPRMSPSQSENIVPAEINHKIGEKLSAILKDYICPWKTVCGGGFSVPMTSPRTLTHSVNKAWLTTIMDKADKVYAFEEPEDGFEPRFKWYRRRRIAEKMYAFCSDDEDMENIQPPTKSARITFAKRDNNFDCKIVKKNDTKDESNRESDTDSKGNLEETKYVVGKRTDMTIERRNEWECERRLDQLEMQSRGVVAGTNSRDCDIKCDPPQSRRLDEPNFRVSEENHKKPVVSQKNIVGSISNKSNCDNLDKLAVKEPYNTQVTTSNKVDYLPSKSEHHKMSSLDVSVVNPDLSAILAEWEAESVSSLSPKSDTLFYKSGETKNDVIQSFLNLIPGMTISPRSSNSGSRNAEYTCSEVSENGSSKVNEVPHSTSKSSSPNTSLSCKYSPLLVVLRPRNCNQDKDCQKSKESSEDKCKILNKDEVMNRVNSVKDQDLSMVRQRMVSGCSVRFDRIYIEVDEEIISTITDIEDDDQGMGFQCALPLSVHGSAYAQLQMVSSSKADKTNINCERVHQTSLDIEQFCFKTAEIICKCEGFKFWFNHDYDCEIVDVCPLSGDILGVVCLCLNAEKKTSKNERRSANEGQGRLYYVVNCVFLWNPGTDSCVLEAYSPFVDVTSNLTLELKDAAKKEAERLRKALYSNSLFMLPAYPPIRTLTHRLWNANDHFRATYEEITDRINLIGFKLNRDPTKKKSSLTISLL